MAKHITMPDGQKIETDYALRAKSAKSADDISSHHVQKGSSGSDSVYYKLATFPVWDNGGNNSSVTVSGRIGGYGSSTIFTLNGMFSNRDGYVGAGTIFGSQKPETYLPRGNLEMWQEEDGTSSLWIKVTGYWVFDFTVTCSNGAKDVYSGQSATPTGTLKWALCKESGMADDVVVGYGKSFFFVDWDGKTSNVTSASKVLDAGNSKPITFRYSSGGVSNPQLLAAWNGYQLTYVNKKDAQVGSSEKLKITWPDGSKVDSLWNWVGKDGTPSWLWGGDDGANMYVYSPANLKVGMADDVSYRHILAAYSGETPRYYPVAKFPVNNSANNSSIIVTGRIGGWVSGNRGYVRAIFSNRDYVAAQGELIGNADLHNTSDLVLYKESDESATLYIKVNSEAYFAFDLSVLASLGATDIYDGSYLTAEPTGTLAWDLNTQDGKKAFFTIDGEGNTSNVTSATNDSQGNLIASQTWAKSAFWPISNNAIFPTWQVGDTIALSEYKQDTGNVFGYKVANGDFHLVSGNVTTTLNPPLNKAKNTSAGYADTDGQRAPYILFSVDGKDTKNAAIDYRVRYIFPELPSVETSTTNSANLQSTAGYVYDNRNNKRFLLGTTTESNLVGIQGGKINVTIPAGGAGTRSNRTSVTFPKAFQKADKIIVQLTVNGGYNSEDAGMSVYNGTIKTTGFDVIATWFNAVSATRAITIGWLAYEVK